MAEPGEEFVYVRQVEVFSDTCQGHGMPASSRIQVFLAELWDCGGVCILQ